MKVAHIRPESSAPGGVDTYLRRLEHAMKEEAQEVVWEAQGDGRDLVDRLARHTPDIVHMHGHLPVGLERRLLNAFACVKTLHVHDYCPTGNKFHHTSESVCRRRTGLGCLAHMVSKRCTLSLNPAVIAGFYRTAVSDNRINTRYPALITASSYVKREAVNAGCDENKVHVLPYCVDMSWTKAERNEDSVPLVLFAGRLVAEKGAHHLIESLRRIKSVFFRLVIAGDGPQKRDLEAQVRRYGLDGRVDFLGWVSQENLLSIYLKARCLVLPSLWPEPFGISGLDAMGVGIPVVAYANGGIPDWLTHNRQGILVEPGNAAGLTEALERIILDAAWAKGLGDEGRRSISGRYDSLTHGAGLKSIYETIL